MRLIAWVVEDANPAIGRIVSRALLIAVLRFVPLVVVGLFDALEDHFPVGYAVGQG